MFKPLASDFAKVASKKEWIGIPYSKWDCQEFVEQMLKQVGAYHNYRGSNDMWRNALNLKGTVKEVAEMQGGELLPGTWVFTLKTDGKENKALYKDGINAAHVGIYVGNGRVVHSTTGGVQRDFITSRRWTHAGECKLLDYSEGNLTDIDKIREAYNILGEVLK